MAKRKAKKATKKTTKKSPRTKAAARKKAAKKPARRKRGTYGGNSVSLDYDPNTGYFEAITHEDTSTASVTWIAMGVQLLDPSGNLAGDMQQDAMDQDVWTLYVPNAAPGTWKAVADFEGSDQESGTKNV